MIEDSAKNLTSITWGQEVEDSESWGGSSQQRKSHNNSLNIGNLHWNDLTLWENKNSGPTTDGKFGPNLFDSRPIEIDFETNTLIIHNKLPQKAVRYQKMPIQNEDGLMFVEAASVIEGIEINNRYLIHSGYVGAILLDDVFVETNKIADKIEITAEQALKDSAGNILKTKKGVLPRFIIGKNVLHNLPVGFFEGALGRQKMSIVGGDVLKRFNIIIDSNRENMYLKANGLSLLSYNNG